MAARLTNPEISPNGAHAVASMQTDCNRGKFDFGEAEGRRIEARFDGGTLTSNAGALLLGKADRALRLTQRLSACFVDRGNPSLIEHEIETLVGQRLVGASRSAMKT